MARNRYCFFNSLLIRTGKVLRERQIDRGYSFQMYHVADARQPLQYAAKAIVIRYSDDAICSAPQKQRR